MRSRERIPAFAQALADAWGGDNTYDWRFGQFIINFCSWMYREHNIPDIFYIEDDKLIEYIKEFVQSGV